MVIAPIALRVLRGSSELSTVSPVVIRSQADLTSVLIQPLLLSDWLDSNYATVEQSLRILKGLDEQPDWTVASYSYLC